LEIKSQNADIQYEVYARVIKEVDLRKMPAIFDRNFVSVE